MRYTDSLSACTMLHWITYLSGSGASHHSISTLRRSHSTSSKPPPPPVRQLRDERTPPPPPGTLCYFYDALLSVVSTFIMCCFSSKQQHVYPSWVDGTPPTPSTAPAAVFRRRFLQSNDLFGSAAEACSAVFSPRRCTVSDRHC